MKFFIEKRKSEKSGNEYVALYVDVGYREYCLTFDSSVCADILDMKQSELSLIPLNEKIYVEVK